MHVVWVKLLEHFLSLFPNCELSHFSPSIYRHWVPLVSAAPFTVLYRLIWNFANFFFMVWGCACGLDLIVRSFFVNFSPFIFKQLVPLVNATPLTVLYQLLWNFACVFFMVWGCGCDLDVIVRLFFSFFPHCELNHFSPSTYRQWVSSIGCHYGHHSGSLYYLPREHNSSYNFLLISLELCTCFLHSLAGLSGSVGCAIGLETRRSRVQPPPRSATFFRGDWSWNIF